METETIPTLCGNCNGEGCQDCDNGVVDTADQETVTIKTVDTQTEIDPYNQQIGGLSTSTLWIDPEELTCGVRQDYPGENGTPVDEWNGLVLTCTIPASESGNMLSGSGIRSYLTSPEGQSELRSIVTGWADSWTGNGARLGHLSDAANECLECLAATLAEITEGFAAQTCDDWFGDLTDGELGLSADTTATELTALAERLEKDAEVYLIDDVEGYLISRRDG